MIKPIKEWTVKELYGYARSSCYTGRCSRCPFNKDRLFCEAMLWVREMHKETLDIYAESGGAKYARDN